MDLINICIYYKNTCFVTVLLLKQNTNHFFYISNNLHVQKGCQKNQGAIVKVTGISLAKSLAKGISERKQYSHDTVKIIKHMLTETSSGAYTCLAF